MTQLLVGVRVFLGSSSGPARLQPLIEVILSGKRIYPAREWFRARSWHSRRIESLVPGKNRNRGKYEHQSSHDGWICLTGRGGDAIRHSQRTTRTTSSTKSHPRFGARGCVRRDARGGCPGNGAELFGKLRIAAKWSSRHRPNPDAPGRRASRPVILPAREPFLACRR